MRTAKLLYPSLLIATGLAACSSSDEGLGMSQALQTSCGGDAATPTDDAGSTPGNDAGSTPGTDASGPVVSGGPGCGLASAAFCETFDAPHNSGGKTGDLDQLLWGVSRVGWINPGQGMLNDIPNMTVAGCGTTALSSTPNDVRICNGKLFETINDGGGVVNLDMYPKQPFNFANRTGTVVFDVSADSEGSHGAWPEFIITDKPVPGARVSISAGVPAGAANEIGFTLDGCGGQSGPNSGVGTIYVMKNHVYSQPDFTSQGCITKGSANALNHFEVRISQNKIEVLGTDPGGGPLKPLAVADNLGLTFTQGLVWMTDSHYNARKAIEPGELGTQYNHTFVWDNLGFDGPKTYRDLGFDVPDPGGSGAITFAGDSTTRTGHQIGTGPMDLAVSGVHWDQTPTVAQVVLNTYSFANLIPSISINGGPWIDTATFDDGSYGWRSIAIPIPNAQYGSGVGQIHQGANTISFKSTDWSTTVSNVSLILVAGAKVP